MGTTTVNISAAQVKDLREKTGAPMMDCKQALTEAKGDMEQAVVILRKKGVSVAAKKSARVTSEGSVTSYIHAGGKIGVLVEVNCESDFVARTDDFKELVHDIAMHIAASDPKFVRKEDVTPEAFEREKDIYRAQAAATGKPPQVVEPSSRTRPSPSHSLLPPRSASWARTLPYAALLASRSARLGRQLLPLSLLRRRKSSFRGCFGSPFFMLSGGRDARKTAVERVLSEVEGTPALQNRYRGILDVPFNDYSLLQTDSSQAFRRGSGGKSGLRHRHFANSRNCG